ncbi:MAG: formylglycine-generating enzyme family protein [Planctomycetota bacterium]|nr:MAG: formylglycine-generating enzyme family protein [Planctomycetota bacterium]
MFLYFNGKGNPHLQYNLIIKMKNRFFIITGLIFVGICLTSLYSFAVISSPHEKFEKIKRTFYLKGNRIRVNFELPKDAYLLQITHKIGKNIQREIFFNGIKFTANIFHYRRERRYVETSYIRLPKERVREGVNSVDIIFSKDLASDVKIRFTNYRKRIVDIAYILFPDSVYLPTGKAFLRITPFTNILILLSWIIAYFLGRNFFLSKDRLSLYCQRYLLSLLFLFLLFFVVGWISANSGYRAVLTPDFFWEFVFIVLAPLLAIRLYQILKKNLVFFRKLVDFLFAQKKFNIPVGVVFSVLIIIVNLWVYWPSFFHLFRHDDWFLFFTSKDELPNLWFFINHIDWQLRLPYDRLMFRPFSQSMVALNRVVFDTNYVGFHIITFIKHILATFCLWWFMWQGSHRRISAVFALLFSVLIVNSDPVIWPHTGAYITTAIFTILAVITLCKTIQNQISALKGFVLTGLLLSLNLLTTEVVFLMPICFFIAYWVIFRERCETAVRLKDRCSWFIILLPMFLWGIFFSVHLYFVYPNFQMTGQSSMVALWKPFINLVRVVMMLLSGIFFPFFTGIKCSDKVYVNVFLVGIALLIALIFFCILMRGRIFRQIPKEAIFSIFLIFSVLIIICFGRAWYINILVRLGYIAGHYSYCVCALVIFIIYSFFDFDKMRQQNKLGFSLFTILVFLIVNHAFKTHQINVKIQEETAPLKNYFDSVGEFVKERKKEPDFSFKIIDRPPEIEPFAWYHETCIDGLFNRFIDNKEPKYLLEYDYLREEVKYSVYDKNPQLVAASKKVTVPLEQANYVNPIGIQFKKVSGQGYDFLMGMFEVTQKQWMEVMGYNPSKFRDDSRPVENVSYYMVEDFINRLNRIEDVNLYRLPTEKEYLHLVNLYTMYTSEQDDINKHAWLKYNAEGMTHAAGELHPIAGGFYDLIGNVWEWTANQIYYDSQVKPIPGSPYICFGRSWRDENTNLYDLKTNYPPAFRHEHLGLRLVREIRENGQDGIY